MKLIRNLFKKTDNHLSESEMSIYVNNLRLNSQNLIPESARIHVEKCDDCKNGVVEILGFIQSENIAPETYSDNSSIFAANGTLYRIVPLLAAMFLVVFVQYSIYKLNISETVYAVNEDYEMMVGNVFRSEKIGLLSPQSISNFSKSIIFELAQAPTEILYLFVYDVDENLVHESTFNNAKVMLNLDIEDGNYYWKVESESDLISVGKIVK